MLLWYAVSFVHRVHFISDWFKGFPHFWRLKSHFQQSMQPRRPLPHKVTQSVAPICHFSVCCDSYRHWEKKTSVTETCRRKISGNNIFFSSSNLFVCSILKWDPEISLYNISLWSCDTLSSCGVIIYSSSLLVVPAVLLEGQFPICVAKAAVETTVSALLSSPLYAPLGSNGLHCPHLCWEQVLSILFFFFCRDTLALGCPISSVCALGEMHMSSERSLTSRFSPGFTHC